MNKTIYNTETERIGKYWYRWNAIMKYAGETIRLTVCFGSNGNFIRISMLTDNGWVVVSDEWCLNFDRVFDINPYNNTRDVMVYTRKVIEKAMLNFITDVFGRDAWIDSFCIKDHVKEMSDNEVKPKEARDTHIENFSIQGHYHGATDEELENKYF